MYKIGEISLIAWYWVNMAALFFRHGRIVFRFGSMSWRNGSYAINAVEYLTI